MILVTGGAGYIGSHTVRLLKEWGYEVVIFDSLERGHQDIVESVLKTPFIEGNLQNRTELHQAFTRYPVEAVIHFAAYAYVGESNQYPAKYYKNNVLGTLNLLEAMKDHGINHLVFSSTCATYGIPQQVPITEDTPQQPINPYGMSKLMAEKMIADFDPAYGLKSIRFRYFNAAGAAPDGLLGEDHDPEPHLIPLVLQAAMNPHRSINILGTDYPTPDGTCIRDYIHVVDIAQAHVLGLKYLISEQKSEVFNLGNGNGYSVREVIETAKVITQKPITVKEGDRRQGDPPILISSSQKAQKLLGWQPKYSDLSSMLSHAWQWHQKRHGS